MSVREDVDAGVEVEAPASTLNGYKHVFQARKAAYWLSLSERNVRFLPNGSAKEELPKTKAGNRLDMVRFDDFFLKTNDDELADAIKASSVYGLEIWSYAEKVKEQALAQAAEIRAALASNPELQKALKLTPSDAKDWDVKPKAAEPSLDELEAMTRPEAK
jgi:hypothetical protein